VENNDMFIRIVWLLLELYRILYIRTELLAKLEEIVGLVNDLEFEELP
jgi:hypothetical protein